MGTSVKSLRKIGAIALGFFLVGMSPFPALAISERGAAFSLQCIGQPGGPVSYLRATATLERYKVANGVVVIDKRSYKDVNMDCTPGVNGGFQQNILPTFLDTDGRVVAIDGKVYTNAVNGLKVVHTFHAGNNFAQGSFIAMPERGATTSGEVHYLISITNPSFEP